MNPTTTTSTTSTTTTTTSARRIRRQLAIGGVAAAVALGAAACSDGSASPKAAGTNTPLTTLAPKTGVQAGTTAAQQPAAQPHGQPSSQPTSQPTSQPQGNPAPSAPAPVISSFSTPENIDCHNGNFQNFSASWTTQNAVKTTISIDGPGIYKTYGPNDSDSLPFNCSTPHTFLLTAFGQDGHTVTKSITLQPRNVQTQGSGDPDQ